MYVCKKRIRSKIIEETFMVISLYTTFALPINIAEFRGKLVNFELF